MELEISRWVGNNNNTASGFTQTKQTSVVFTQNGCAGTGSWTILEKDNIPFCYVTLVRQVTKLV